MKKNYLFALLLVISTMAMAQNVTITKIIETGCSDPFVKSVELYVDGTVDFATEVTLNFMQNGNPWADNQIDVTALGTVTDSFVYIVRDIALMQTEFPNTTFTENVNTIVTSSATNGDDGYQVVLNGMVVSQFGKTETDADDEDGTPGAWSHNDAVATRKDGVPDLGTWDPTHWDFTAENDLDDHTSCQNMASTNLETYFATLGSTFSLGSGSGWTPTGTTCTTTLGSVSTSCTTTTDGATNDTYSAMIAFAGGDNGNTFVVNSTAGNVAGDDPTSVATGTIMITDIPEGTDITVTVSDTADGGVCDLMTSVESPICIPLIINEVLYDPASDITGDANGDGTRDALEDEFIEFYNNSNAPLDISGYKVYDSFALSDGNPRHVFPASTIIPANSFLVLFGGGTPTGSFGGSVVQTASEGMEPQLNLSNGGDVITVLSPADDVALVYASSDTGISHGSNESVTRSPDLTGSFVLHSTANASLIFSPGLLSDGSTLSVENERFDSLRLYPNPIRSDAQYLNVSVSSKDDANMRAILYNILGKQVRTQEVNNNQVDISGLSSGVYLLKITQSNRQMTTKLIIE
jgi:hypothetical protein